MIVSIPTLVIIIIIITGAIIGGAAWFAFYTRRLTQGTKTATERAKTGSQTFRWSYIILPLAIFLLSIALSVYFYRQLPTEVAILFHLDGSPYRWLSREIAMVLFLVPQFFLTLLAGAITWGITKLGIIFSQTDTAWIKI